MPRATPMPADERRAALIAATEPLLVQLGREVSTRQIAEAAGIAEGTIFRVFPTKEALIDAVIADAFDVDRTCLAIARIDPSLDLDAQLTAAVDILQTSVRRIFGLFHALRLHRSEDHDDSATLQARRELHNERLNSAVAELLSPHRDRLRLDPYGAADVLRAMTLAMTHFQLGGGHCSDPATIVDLVLHGVSRCPAPTLRPISERSSC